jgi:hypothetical protein
MEHDSELSFSAGFGEIQTDDGLEKHWIELADREDTLTIDSLHKSSYFLSTEPFTMPAQGTLTYSPWLGSSSDSVWRARHAVLQYNLNLYDSSDQLLRCLDSLIITDSTPHIALAARTVLLNNADPIVGTLRLERMNGSMLDSGTVQDMLTPKLLTSMKRANARSRMNAADDGVQLKALENPAHHYCDLVFLLPDQGEVSVDVYDALGRAVSELTPKRLYRSGEHELRWSPASSLPSGIYTILLRYWNGTKSLQVSYVR